MEETGEEENKLYVLHHGKKLTLESEEFHHLPELPKKLEDDIKDFAKLLIERAIEKHIDKLPVLQRLKESSNLEGEM